VSSRTPFCASCALWHIAQRCCTTACTSANRAGVQAVVQQRCAMCHNAQLAQKGVRLDTPQALLEQAASIHTQAVVTRQMPLNNATQITEQERSVLARWFAAGAPRD